MPGLRKLGEFLPIHSNSSGYFDAASYSSVLKGVVEPRQAGLHPSAYMFLLDDAASTHKRKTEPKRLTLVYHHDDTCTPQELKDWLWHRRMIKGSIPGVWISERFDDRGCVILFSVGVMIRF